MSIAAFAAKNSFVEINKTVRENSNGYPFITFINSANKAENVYFSKSQSANFAEGDVITAGVMKNLQIAEVVNNAGETRTKLVGFGESSRLTLADLLS